MWLATSRYEIEQAPAGLGFVHDFLNTKPRGRSVDEELLGSVESAQRWLEAALGSWATASKKRVTAPKLSSADLKELRHLRASLEQQQANPGGAAPRAAQPLLDLPLTAQLKADGSALLLPAGAGFRFVGSLIVLEAVQAQAQDSWRRLKICRNERCTCAFYDRSKNNSAVWHSATVCGNAVNLRASRARRRDE